MQVLVAILAAVAALFAARRVRRHWLPARLRILSPRHSTSIGEDGAVRSIQCGELTLDRAELDRLWTPANLENLARTYWRFLSRVTLGLIQVKYGPRERRVVLLGTRLTLLRFGPPEYSIESDHGAVRWAIRDGLLVARNGRGKGALALDVWRDSPEEDSDRARLRIEVAVTNFYSAIASRFSTPVYRATQSVIHVLVTHAFLRSLAGLDLAQSRVGMLAALVDSAGANGASSAQPVESHDGHRELESSAAARQP